MFESFYLKKLVNFAIQRIGGEYGEQELGLQEIK
jgi:hypothetical protein